MAGLEPTQVNPQIARVSAGAYLAERDRFGGPRTVAADFAPDVLPDFVIPR
jgi:hypothetical protein